MLAALAAQTVRPRRVVAVDTGSTDESADLLLAATGSVDAVLRLPRRTGYGAAVAAGLAARPDAGADAHPDAAEDARPDDREPAWVWLLHDDCAPEPDALERLLEHAVARRRPPRCSGPRSATGTTRGCSSRSA